MTDNNDDTGGERKRGRPERPGFARGPGGDRPLTRGKPRDLPPPPVVPQSGVMLEPAEERIAKVIARAGIASRRDAEAMIAEGRVTLNGAVLQSPAINVGTNDQITVDGEPLPLRERTRLWIFHKPPGVVTTARDPQGRTTVFDTLPEDLPRVVTIGRLDINTEGLLLLTNDGGLARVIAHPETGWLRRYRVRAHGEVTQADLDGLRGGITVDDMEYGPIEAVLDRVQGDNVWITLGLREGKNREVKRVLEYLGLRVNRLIRLSFGPFQLGELEQGLVEEVRAKVLRDQLGDKLAAEAGVDFTSPVREPIAPFGSPKRTADGVGSAGPRRESASRPDRSARPERGMRSGAEGRDRSGRDERRPGRAAGPPRAGARPEAGERPERPRFGEKRSTVWRGDDEAPRRSAHTPRRGEDPKAARASAAERPRERAPAIEGREGRKVTVERLVSAPAPEERRPRSARGERPAGGPRPDRNARDERGARDARPPFAGRAARERPSGPPRGNDDRPPRRFSEGPARGRSSRDEPRGERGAFDGAQERAPRGKSGFGPSKGRPGGTFRGGSDKPGGPPRGRPGGGASKFGGGPGRSGPKPRRP